MNSAEPDTCTPKDTPRPRKKPAKYKKAPGAPRRFKSAYMFFSTEKHKSIRAELKKAGRSEPTTVIAKMVSKSWKELPFSDREKFEEMARKDKARYNVEKSMYNGPWRVSTRKRTPKDASAPKRPMSAFLAFSHAKRSEVKEEHPTANNTNLSRILAEKWRNAADSEKKEFIEREELQRQRYKEAIAVWRAAEKEKLDRERMEREEKAMQKADELARAGTASTVAALPLHPEQKQHQDGEEEQQHIYYHEGMMNATRQPTHFPGHYGQVSESTEQSHGAYNGESTLVPLRQPNLQEHAQGRHQEVELTAATASSYDPRYHHSYYHSSWYPPQGYNGHQWPHYGG